jgi:hypothetical protein
MSFFKRLFGSRSAGVTASFAPETQDYKDHTIFAEPVKDNGQWRLAGRVTKTIDGEMKEHKFVRADVFSSREDAVNFAFKKGELIVDQLGKTLFS